MKNIYLSITLVIVSALLSNQHVFAFKTELHDYYEYDGADRDAPSPTDHLAVTVQKKAFITSSYDHFAGQIDYIVYAFGYAGAGASPIIHPVLDTFYTATAWCETTGDRDTLATPSRNYINTSKVKGVGDERYFGDEYREYSTDRTTEIGVIYKQHPVVAIHDNPWWFGDSSRERYLNLYQTSYKVEAQYNSPTGLDANPYAKAEIDSTSISFLNKPMGRKSKSTP